MTFDLVIHHGMLADGISTDGTGIAPPCNPYRPPAHETD
jgi:hypothetical protein